MDDIRHPGHRLDDEVRRALAHNPAARVLLGRLREALPVAWFGPLTPLPIPARLLLTALVALLSWLLGLPQGERNTEELREAILRGAAGQKSP